MGRRMGRNHRWLGNGEGAAGVVVKNKGVSVQ
jgi:hypothetical protein